MNVAIEITDLHKDYAGEKALQGVSFSVEEGRLYGMIGADGAGKTTVLRILATLLNPDRGRVQVLGLDAARDYLRIRPEIGYMPQKFSLYPDLTVGENMDFFAGVFGVRGAEKSERIRRLLSFSRLGPFQDRRAGQLSGGMKQKLALSCILIHQPRLIVLDEPTTGVDPVSRTEFWNILRELNRQGITILFSTPYMGEARLCTELVFMHQGHVVLCGQPEELLRGYPLSLYEIRGKAGTIGAPPGVRLLPGVRQLYPVAGKLHLAADHRLSPEAEIMPWIRTVIPEAESLARIEPDLEDLFFQVLSK